MGRETKTERLRHRVDESQGDVEVVTLVGTVGGGHAEKLMAQHVSQGVGGVHDLVDATEVNPASDMRRSGNELRATLEQVPVRAELNRIEVATTAPTPNDVRTAIVEALGLRAGNSASRIDVVVDGSTVTLRGAVQSPAVRAAVVGGFGHAPGISQLRDELSIKADRPPGPGR